MTKRILNRGSMTVKANELLYDAALTEVEVIQSATGISTITVTGCIDSISAIDEDGAAVMTNTDGMKWEPTQTSSSYMADYLADCGKIPGITISSYMADYLADCSDWQQVPGKIPGITMPKKWPIPEIFIPNPGRIEHVNCKCGHTKPTINCCARADFSGSVLPCQKESEMKALYRIYAVNRRTLVHWTKEFVGVDCKDTALNDVLLKHADEIKLNVGNPEECEFELWQIMNFLPIKNEEVEDSS